MEDALTGDVTAFVFDKMEEAEWTGTITHSDGRQEEISVPVMEDTETGRIILGDAKRKILCADFYEYQFHDTLTPKDSEGGTGQVAVVVPEGQYAMSLTLTGKEGADVLYYLYAEDRWESGSRDELSEKLGNLDMENVIEAGSGAKKELQGPQW